MTLKKLRSLQEIARQSLSISAAALALGTSQPGISRQIQELEDELGVALLVRRRNRIIALTEAGEAVLATAKRLLAEAENIGLIAAESRQGASGKLVVATRCAGSMPSGWCTSWCRRTTRSAAPSRSPGASSGGSTPI
jgi:DNA-binding transcriptional LysR family regulator